MQCQLSFTVYFLYVFPSLSLARVFWSTKTRPRCCFASSDPTRQPDARWRQDRIYSSKKNQFTILIRSHVLILAFSYLIENEVCYLVLCDKLFSKRIAFNFLEDLAQEFHTNYGRKVNTVTRPYQFIEFDIYIQKAKKSLTDRRRNINTINNQLQDVQRIMVQNIDDVLQRGAVLSELDTKTQNLSLLSQKYKKSATQLNRRSMYVKAAIGGIILLVLGLYFWVF